MLHACRQAVTRLARSRAAAAAGSGSLVPRRVTTPPRVATPPVSAMMVAIRYRRADSDVPVLRSLAQYGAPCRITRFEIEPPNGNWLRRQRDDGMSRWRPAQPRRHPP